MSHRFRLFQFDREHHRTDRRGRRGHGWLIGLLALMIALPPLLQFPGAIAAAPPGFRDELVADMDRPTAVAFAPGGLLLVTEQTGQLWVIDDAGKPATPALDLSAEICVVRNRGLLGVAVDPKFTQNRAIYLYYTFNKFGNCPTYDDGDGPENPVTRVSRFTLGNDNVVDRDSEKMLLNDIPSYSEGIHDAGDLGFGKDGYLYISIGDAVCDLDDILDGDGEVTKCDKDNPNAQKLNLIYGKILRITRDGDIPRDNPYRGNGTSRCGITGGTGTTTSGRICQEIFASGLRNPFRFAFDPSARGTRFFINDVGNEVWEEIDVGKAGANYGYNRREGYCRIDSTQDCRKRNPPRGLTNPIHAYNHNTGCRSVTGGAFSPVKTDWPAKYGGDYFYADFVCGKIFTLSESERRGSTSRVFAEGFGGFSLIDLAFGPAELAQPNGERGLYYATFQNGDRAAIRRIAFGGEAARTADDGKRTTETPTDRRDRTSDEAPPLSADAPTDQHGDTLDRERDQRNDRANQAESDRGDADAAPPKDDEGGRVGGADSPDRGDAGAKPPKNRERSD